MKVTGGVLGVIIVVALVGYGLLSGQLFAGHWKLSVTSAEKSALRQMLGTCGG